MDTANIISIDTSARKKIPATRYWPARAPVSRSELTPSVTSLGDIGFNRKAPICLAGLFIFYFLNILLTPGQQ